MRLRRTHFWRGSLPLLLERGVLTIYARVAAARDSNLLIGRIEEIKLSGNKCLRKLLELSKEREEKWMAPDSRIELIQALIPLGLKAVEEMLQEEVANIAGERYQHHSGDLKRWGSNPGSVYVGGQKLGVSVPRVRDTGVW